MTSIATVARLDWVERSRPHGPTGALEVRGAPRDGLRGVRGRPVEADRSRSAWSGAGTRQRGRGTVAVVTRSGWTTPIPGRDVLGNRRWRRPGSSSRGGGGARTQDRDVAKCCSSAARGGRPVAREAPSRGAEREIAVGGQRSRCAGSACRRRDLPPLHGEHQAATRRWRGGGRALIGAGPKQPIDPMRSGGVRRRDLAGTPGRLAADLGCRPCSRRRAQPARGAGAGCRPTTEFGSTVDRGARCGWPARTPGILAELEPVLAEVIITANSSPRAMARTSGRAGVGGVRIVAVSVEHAVGRGGRAGRGAGRGGRRVRRRSDHRRLGGDGGRGACAVRKLPA